VGGGIVAGRTLTPPDATPAATGARSERVEIVDMNSRRLLRGFCAAIVGLLIYAFELRGHSVPGTAITAITLLGFGPDALVAALKKKPAVAGGGAAALVALALVALALAGDLADVHAFEMFAALGAGVLPMVDEVSRLTRG
jgi:peptidoglycan/LPS O-acetylase OafA/YrhL